MNNTSHNSSYHLFSACYILDIILDYLLKLSFVISSLTLQVNIVYSLQIRIARFREVE